MNTIYHPSSEDKKSALELTNKALKEGAKTYPKRPASQTAHALGCLEHKISCLIAEIRHLKEHPTQAPILP